MINIAEWLDSVLKNSLPEEVVAIMFNIYEGESGLWSLEMVGTDNFDSEDSDWACNEVFDTRDDLHLWVQKSSWEEILQEVTDEIKKYIKSGKYSEKLKSYSGIGVGFVDGDITIVYQKLH